MTDTQTIAVFICITVNFCALNFTAFSWIEKAIAAYERRTEVLSQKIRP